MYKERCDCTRCPQCSSSVVNILTGIGFGILVSRPLAGDHPLRWGAIVLLVSLLGHLYCLFLSKQVSVAKPEQKEDQKS